MNKRKAYQAKLDAQLEEWNKQLSVLRAKADKTKAESKIEYCKMLEALQPKLDNAKAKLKELKTASDEAWEELKAGLERAWAEVKTSIEAAASKFR